MRFLSLRKIFVTFAVLTCVSTILGQSVYWSPNKGTLQKGKSNAIDLFFDTVEPEGQPELPNVANFSINFRGRSNSRTIINGRLSAKTIFNFQAIPTKLGEVVIPSFDVETAQGTMTVPEARFEVVEATVGNTGISPSEVFISLFQNRDEKIYQGEVFELEYVAGAKQDYQLADLSIPEWSPTNLVTGGLVDAQVTGVNYQGDKYTVKLYKAKAMATEAGTIEVPGAKQEATVVIGRRRDFMFQEPVYDAFTIESDPFALEILPLPEGAPESFNGAVGKFDLESRVVPEEVQVGEPVTWTLELTGQGNWPAGIGVPERSVSSRFRAIQPQIKNEFAEDDLFNGTQTEDIVLIPTEAGSFEFGPLQYTYFDAQEEAYKTIEIPARTVTVVPAEPNSPTSTTTTAPSSGSSSPTDQYADQSFDLSPSGQNTFEKPPELLKDVKPGISPKELPLASINLLPATVVAVSCSFALWFLLALTRSVATDPRRNERSAHAELRQIAKSELPSDPEKRKALHHRWREAAARYFALDAVEPSPDEIAYAATSLKDQELAKLWREAWLLSDQELFGKKQGEQSDWHRIQKTATEATPKKGYRPNLILTRKAWLPMCTIFLAANFGPTDASAQESAAAASELYEQGDFSSAVVEWEKALTDEPSVFEIRYNAGLAAAQLGDWSKAWAFWTGAYCLNPSDPDVAWNLRIAHQHTSAFDPVLQSLIEGEDIYSIIGMNSPAAWQAMAKSSVWALGLFLCIALAALYWPRAKKAVAPLLLIAFFAGLLSYFCSWAHSKYEALGDPDTLLVIAESELLSIPSDLQQEQVSTRIAEGTVAKKQKKFLSWIKIQLPNGESGWVRRESLMPLYGSLAIN